MSPVGKIILVKCGEMSRRIRIDGPSEFIKDSIKSAFGLRTKRLFWLEDEDGVVQTLSRDMPLATYYLNLDQGMCVSFHALFVCLAKEKRALSGDAWCGLVTSCVLRHRCYCQGVYLR